MSRLSTDSHRTAHAERSGWTRCRGLTKARAEELLDWLEANGYERRLSVDEKGYVICYRRLEQLSAATTTRMPERGAFPRLATP